MQLYKKFSLMIVLFVCLAFFFSIIWLFTGYCVPRNDTLWINNLYRVKDVYAAIVKGPKMVVVAGSSGLYGVSTIRMQRHFQIPTVNLATHGGLRDYYLHKAQKNLNPGDFVILAPEYTQYFYDDPMPSIKADYIVNFDKSHLRQLPLEEQNVILKIYAHPWSMLKHEIKHRRGGNASAVKFDSVSRNLNINGDILNNKGVKKQTLKPVHLACKFDPDRYLIQKISGFIDWCRKNSITVAVSWPGTLPFDLTADTCNQQFLDSLKSYLSDLGVERLGEPEDFFVKPADLYDTAYHLNQSGVAKRTATLIGFLEKSAVFNDWKKNYPRPLK